MRPDPRQNPDAGRVERPATSSRDDVAPIALSNALVRYTDRPNRCTIYPPSTTGVARMSTWLSADADAFVDLESAR